MAVFNIKLTSFFLVIVFKILNFVKHITSTAIQQAAELQDLLSQIYQQTRSILQWVPPLSVDHGNERADKMAKEVNGLQPNFAVTCYQKKNQIHTLKKSPVQSQDD